MPVGVGMFDPGADGAEATGPGPPVPGVPLLLVPTSPTAPLAPLAMPLGYCNTAFNGDSTDDVDDGGKTGPFPLISRVTASRTLGSEKNLSYPKADNCTSAVHAKAV